MRCRTIRSWLWPASAPRSISRGWSRCLALIVLVMAPGEPVADSAWALRARLEAADLLRRVGWRLWPPCPVPVERDAREAR